MRILAHCRGPAPITDRDRLVERRNARIADSARWVGDSVSPVSVAPLRGAGCAPASCPGRSPPGGPHPCRRSPEGGLRRRTDKAPPCRLGPAPAGSPRAWDRHGTRRPLIPALPGYADGRRRDRPRHPRRGDHGPAGHHPRGPGPPGLPARGDHATAQQRGRRARRRDRRHLPVRGV